MGNPTPPDLLKRDREMLLASLQSKIDIVKVDIEKLQADGASPRKVEALIEYKKYLEDELKSIQHGHQS